MMTFSLALLVYEYLLTVSRELRFVWSKRFSAATAIFLLNRYVIIILYAVDLATGGPIIPSVRVRLSSQC